MSRGEFGGRQRGYFVLLTVLVVLMAGGILLFTRLNSKTVRDVAQNTETQNEHTRIRDALVNFVSANGYLPCPADGALLTGLAMPDPMVSTSCTNPNGVVPWVTLGLSVADATDPYQNRISYRVYSGAGGLTQARGATMVDCDLIRAPLPVPQTVGVDGAGLCRTDHDTSPTQFYAGKGLSVTDTGAVIPAVAFVLISHGKNGAGAYTVNGSRNTLPNMASSEYGHTQASGQASGPFVVKVANTTELAPTDTNYFDDTVTYLKLTDLISRAKVGAKDWPDPPAPPPPILNSTTFTSSNVAAAAAAAGATPVGTSTNTAALTVNSIAISSSTTSGGAREISSLNGTSGYGIGVLGTAATTGGTISGTDLLKLNFGQTGQKFAIMLVDFGSVSGRAEQASLVFKNGTTTVLSATLVSCRSGSQLASYSINVGAAFDRVELSALTRVSTGTSSDFLLAEVSLCGSNATTCATTGASATTNCAYP